VVTLFAAATPIEMIEQRSVPRRDLTRVVLPAFGLTALAFYTALYIFWPAGYLRALPIFFENIFSIPFVDAHAVMSQIQCWERGVNVYVTNPCDAIGRPANYSPLWLRLRFLPTDIASLNAVGMTMNVLFMLSLAALPTPRRPWQLGLIMLGIFSSRTVFALERANVDVIIFAIIATAGVLIQRGLLRRSIGYCMFVVCGFLKFYPFVLLLLLVRERLSRFLVFGVLAVIVTDWFGWQYSDEIQMTLHNLPIPNYFSDNFGAKQLPVGLGVVVPLLLRGETASFATELLSRSNVITAEMIAFMMVSLLCALVLVTRNRYRAALAALPEDEFTFLVMGAALITGCFFAGVSVGYRIIAFILPGMVALAQGRRGAGSGLFRWTLAGAIFIMWWMTVRHAIALGGKLLAISAYPLLIAYYTAWTLQEVAWWAMVTVLLGILFAFVLESKVWEMGVRGRTVTVEADSNAGRPAYSNQRIS
jgi:hypothetical protein